MSMKFSVEEMLGTEEPYQITPDDLRYEYVLDFGYEVCKACEQAGITQKELAKKCGMSQPTLSKLLSGFSNPTILSLERIANALGLKLETPALVPECNKVSIVDTTVNTTPEQKRPGVTSSPQNNCAKTQTFTTTKSLCAHQALRMAA
ncbi:helix-turn-helix transcriptional regulator [Paraeggerthella sp.]|uniref:helix-turn-helix domain-containing protein n=1 Tax=Paraeggerthella sp. TaxID=2897350 RepID=UPI001C689E90